MIESLKTYSTSRQTLLAYAEDIKLWDKEFMSLLRQHEKSRAGIKPAEPSPSSPPSEPLPCMNENEILKPTNTDAPKSVMAASAGGRRVVSAKSKKKGKDATSLSPSTAKLQPQSKKAAGTKSQRKWDENGIATEHDMASLDFSQGDSEGKANLSQWIDESKLGKTRSDGVYELADDDDNSTTVQSQGLFGFLSSGPTSSLISRITGAKRSLTKQDLAPILHKMQMHLQSKNAANDVASLICEGVEKRLIGERMGSFGSVKAEVRASLEESITRILTPSTSTDILLEIASRKQRRQEILAKQPSQAMAHQDLPELNPYSIGFVGVNGVGKSTNLAKVCFWLLQNQYRVLIAACDTFRSGAVEQLRTHVRNLGELEINGRRVADGLPDSGAAILDLYERGYGKDAAGIARDALTYARNQGFDVVLIDTAGRMQDNEPLMRALAKLIAVNNPDKVLFVGEALVGNEAVDQLTKFNRALKDYSGMSNPRGLDGCLLTKWDTVDVRA